MKTSQPLLAPLSVELAIWKKKTGNYKVLKYLAPKCEHILSPCVHWDLCHLWSLFRRYNKYLSTGRVIRQVVTLADWIEDLINEADHWVCMEQANSDDPTEHSEECIAPKPALTY